MKLITSIYNEFEEHLFILVVVHSFLFPFWESQLTFLHFDFVFNWSLQDFKEKIQFLFCKFFFFILAISSLIILW